MEKEMMLRTALKVNGVFSMLSAMAGLFLGSSVLAINEMAKGNGTLFAIQLAVFGTFVLFNAFREGISKVMIIIIIILDTLYVAGAVVDMILLSPELSFGGMVLILISTIAVGVFATFQSLGLKRVWKS